MYYKDHKLLTFDAKILEVFANVVDKNRNNIVILNQSAVYPTSGGQEHDTGILEIEGVEGEFKIINA